MSEYKRFWVDAQGEYYRFRKADIIIVEENDMPDTYTLSDTVPDFIKVLLNNGTLRVLPRRFDNHNNYVMSLKTSYNEVPDIIEFNDCIIQPSYEKDVYAVDAGLFEQMFHGED